MGYSPGDCKESDTTEQLTHTYTCMHEHTHTQKSRGFFHLVCRNPLPEIEVSGFQLSGDSVAVGNLISTAVCEPAPEIQISFLCGGTWASVHFKKLPGGF